VIIRTFEIDRSTVELGVGGGITVDSVPVREWYECLQKAAPLVTAARSTLQIDLAAPGPRASPTVLAAGVFETMLTLGPTVLRLPAHLARLDRSCRELYEAGVPDDLADRVHRAVAHLSPGSGRRALRVVAEPVGPRLSFTMSLAPVAQRRTESALVRSARSDSLWRHKWADRSELAAAEASAGDRVPYFVTPAGDVAETSRGNIFCQDAEGVWLTPPLDEHLLPGVTRRDVLDVFASIGVPTRLTSFPPRTLQTASGAFWTSSLSGAVIITDVDGSALPRCQALTESINAALGFIAADLRR
nr:aminotransferase class IV [Propionibacteriaceae bacterium]